jgi:hypothetical protein
MADYYINRDNDVGCQFIKFVMLSLQSDTTRNWAKRLAESVPEARVIVAEDADTGGA